MTFMTLLETLLIGPLKLIFEIVFVITNRVLNNRPGLAIIALSMVVNILVLPLYRRADAIQEEARDKETKLRDGINHIKKVFSGDERMMILQAYYRRNDYRPTDVLNESVSLLLQIPFFMAAYDLLSNMAMLNGVSFGPIRDLGAPDGMLVMGGIAINILPILMTAINILSGMIYSKGLPLKSKIQIYGLAAVFLVLLYDSPSGLVFYWTLNNVFSLGKNILDRIKYVKKLGTVLLPVAGIGAILFGLMRPMSINRRMVVIALGVLCMVPQMWALLKNKVTITGAQPKPNKKIFALGCVCMTILTGMLIPSTYIGASPLEYVNPNLFHDPLLYILVSTCMAAGFFLVWLRIFYWLANDRIKVLFGWGVWVLCGVMLVNYMFFGRNAGIIFPNLRFPEGILYYTEQEAFWNPVVLAILAVVMVLFVCKWERHAVTVLLAGAIALSGMSVMNMVTIRKETNELKTQLETTGNEIPQFTMSKTGKNVVLIMMDKAMGQLMPYILNEKPELMEKFDGFTFYPNTVSFGATTIVGSPALYGGYEYTPFEMNRRSDKLLVEKHNEALKVLPVLFSQNGYKATFLNPTYVNYKWLSDPAIFDEYPEIDAYLTTGKFTDVRQIQAQIDSNYRNFFCFSLMKTMPVFLQRALYAAGTYNAASDENDIYSAQIAEGTSVARGFQSGFLDEYAVLSNMSTMTNITEEPVNTYMAIDNGTTHNPMLLQAPDYTLSVQVDNRAYDVENSDRFALDGKVVHMDTGYQMGFYHANMAAMLKLSEWFDYLKDNDLYDNTRIILVADHGAAIEAHYELVIDSGLGYYQDMGAFNPLLMVKDFDAHGFTTSDTFMTNADAPYLAVEGLIDNPVNPFTGKSLDMREYKVREQMLAATLNAGASLVAFEGPEFPVTVWASIEGDIWNPDNWHFSNAETVSKE